MSNPLTTLCRQFVAGVCNQSDCEDGHSLHTVHNERALNRHRLNNRTDEEVVNILRQKESAETQKVCSLEFLLSHAYF